MVMVLPFFRWANATWFGVTIRNSSWLFPVIEIFHLLALAVLGGSIILVNFRLLGLRMTDVPVGRLARDAQPWLVGSLLVMLASGFLLFTSEAMKCYANTPFWIKMLALFAAIVFTFTAHRRVVLMDAAHGSLTTKRVVAVVSLGLWLLVGMAGRGIGLF